ncbi:unnamed protein product [Rhizophagus irregularis]|uniref:Uncharacterized protein n=1 Tax=Rhizophagus irregularis TaxID=588596 RepID=A0A915Z2T4_9GLOM|nr:unnamed protein product [Rhizophagus irregularis]CAB4490949.1 unnamed protein product [Rhizophagus irregularis]CAB5359223.1 unnamed protein product [Rhizophagus irregularis]CAB5361944.1 unnamed protein product [Rhizophagus irregularis]
MDLYSKELNMPIEYIEMKNKLKEYFAQEASRSSHNSHYSHSSTIEIQDSTVTAPLITTKSFDTLLLCLVIIIGFFIWYFYCDVLFIVYRIYIIGDMKLKIN